MGKLKSRGPDPRWKQRPTQLVVQRPLMPRKTPRAAAGAKNVKMRVSLKNSDPKNPTGRRGLPVHHQQTQPTPWASPMVQGRGGRLCRPLEVSEIENVMRGEEALSARCRHTTIPIHPLAALPGAPESRIPAIHVCEEGKSYAEYLSFVDLLMVSGKENVCKLDLEDFKHIQVVVAQAYATVMDRSFKRASNLLLQVRAAIQKGDDAKMKSKLDTMVVTVDTGWDQTREAPHGTTTLVEFSTRMLMGLHHTSKPPSALKHDRITSDYKGMSGSMDPFGLEKVLTYFETTMAARGVDLGTYVAVVDGDAKANNVFQLSDSYSCLIIIPNVIIIRILVAV